jgi:hypothetical protein
LIAGRLIVGSGVLIAMTLLPGSSLASTGVRVVSVTVPAHVENPDRLTLIDASPERFVAVQGTPTPYRVLTGAPGSVLAHRFDLTLGAQLVGLSGSTLCWLTQERDSVTWLVHRRDLAEADTDTDTVADGAEAGAEKAIIETYFEPVAWTPDGWLAAGNGSLVRHVIGGRTVTLLTGIDTDLYGTGVEVRADDQGAVVLYRELEDSGDVRSRIGLITYGRPGIEILSGTDPDADDTEAGAGDGAELDDDAPFGPEVVALSPDTVVWLSETAADGRIQVNRRLRSGGATATDAVPVGHSVEAIAATDDQIAIQTSGRSWDPGRVDLLRGGSWRTVALPGALTDGVRAAGPEFAAVVTDDHRKVDLQLGIYGFGAADPARAATTVPARLRVADLNLSAGQLNYTDYGPLGPLARASAWHRTVTGSAALQLGPPRELGHEETTDYPQTEDGPAAAETGSGSPISSFSAGRGVLWSLRRIQEVGEGDAAIEYRFRLLDRGRVIKNLEVGGYPGEALEGAGASGNRLRASGPYLLINDQVFRVDGLREADLRYRFVSAADLFGPSVLFSTRHGQVQLFDVRRPLSASNPKIITGEGICDSLHVCAGAVAIWGETLAWLRLDGTIRVRSQLTGAERTIDPGRPVTGLRLSEGVLSWVEAEGLRVLDLRSPASVPIAVSGLQKAVVDGGLIAGVQPGGAIRVQALPFARRYRPRLIGVLAPAGFSPDGDRKADTWSLQADFSTPVTGARLTLTRAGRVVRVLTGSGPDGSIRNLVWNGRTAAGKRAPAGTYRWRLTASGTAGAALAPGGRGPITGTVVLERKR